MFIRCEFINEIESVKNRPAEDVEKPLVLLERKPLLSQISLTLLSSPINIKRLRQYKSYKDHFYQIKPGLKDP